MISRIVPFVLLAILVRISHAARRPIVTTPPPNQSPLSSAGTEVIQKV